MYLGVILPLVVILHFTPLFYSYLLMFCSWKDLIYKQYIKI